jgi:membrane protein
MGELSRVKAKAIKYLKVFILTMKGFGNDKIGVQAATLSFFSAMSLVPFIAVVFAITKGFGMYNKMVELIYTYFEGNEEIINYLIKFAGNVVASTKKGLFGVISFLFFISTVFGLLFNIERSFNFIWKTDNGRPFHKKIMFYTLFLIVSPLFIMLFLTLAVLYINTIDSLGSRLNDIIPITSIFTWLLFYGIVTMAFSLLYKYIPNTRVRYISSLNASLVVAGAFVIVQMLYLETQIMVSGLNAIYGVFAAVPLFLVWMNISWTIILFGAELSNAFQNVDNYKLN